MELDEVRNKRETSLAKSSSGDVDTGLYFFDVAYGPKPILFSIKINLEGILYPKRQRLWREGNPYDWINRLVKRLNINENAIEGEMSGNYGERSEKKRKELFDLGQ